MYKLAFEHKLSFPFFSFPSNFWYFSLIAFFKLKILKLGRTPREEVRNCNLDFLSIQNREVDKIITFKDQNTKLWDEKWVCGREGNQMIEVDASGFLNLHRRVKYVPQSHGIVINHCSSKWSESGFLIYKSFCDCIRQKHIEIRAYLGYYAFYRTTIILLL